jgi:ATP-binding cassette subfamily B protein
VVNADSIIVLQDGKIAEQGTHGDLIGRGGLYAAMWDRQREADEAAERLRRTREQAGDFLPPEPAPAEAAE